MKGFSIASCLFFVLTLSMSNSLSGQSEDNTPSLTQHEKEKLILLANTLFEIGPNKEFNLTSDDVKPSFEHIPDAINYDASYLQGLIDSLGKDETNPIILKDIAQYYASVNKPLLARSYYEKSYEHLEIDLFEDNIAAYYSLRAVLKNQLNEPDALDDIERALELNPNDSLSLYIYPLMLLSTGSYDKARKLISNALEAKPDNASYPYMILVVAEIAEVTRTFSMHEKDKLIRMYKGKNYDEIIDYSLLDKYASMYMDNLEITNARMMVDLFGLFMKIILSEPTEDHKISFNYNDHEYDKLNGILEKLSLASEQNTINEFSLNKCYGFAYFMLRQWDRSLYHFNKAIQVFPSEKENGKFSPAECHDGIITIYWQISDTQNYRAALRRKIAAEKNRINSVDEMMLLAFDYFCDSRIKEADDLCKEVMQLDSNNFDVLRLKSHLNFLQGSNLLSQFYLENAEKNIRNADDHYHLSMQHAIYLLYKGDIEGSKSVVELVKKSIGNDNCLLCDQLMKEFYPGK